LTHPARRGTRCTNGTGVTGRNVRSGRSANVYKLLSNK
jgi:hypothetical protein